MDALDTVMTALHKLQGIHSPSLLAEDQQPFLEAKEALRLWLAEATAPTSEAASGAGEREDDAPSRIWLCGYDTDHGDISWSSEPNPSGDPEVDGRQVAYVRASLPPATDPAIPEGWLCVPPEATRDIIEAADLAHDPAQAYAMMVKAAALAAAPTIPSTGEAVPDRFANDAAAKALYDSWSDMPGWVPWVERGNSDMQERARREVTITATEDDEARVDAWNEFAGDHLTDGKGYAAAIVWDRCRAAFERAWPEGWEAANAAAFAALTASNSAGHAATEPVTNAYNLAATEGEGA